MVQRATPPTCPAAESATALPPMSALRRGLHLELQKTRPMTAAARLWSHLIAPLASWGVPGMRDGPSTTLLYAPSSTAPTGIGTPSTAPHFRPRSRSRAPTSQPKRTNLACASYRPTACRVRCQPGYHPHHDGLSPASADFRCHLPFPGRVSVRRHQLCLDKTVTRMTDHKTISNLAASLHASDLLLTVYTLADTSKAVLLAWFSRRSHVRFHGQIWIGCFNTPAMS